MDIKKSPLKIPVSQQPNRPRSTDFDQSVYSSQANEAIKNSGNARIACEELFSMFTADIIKERTTFTR